MHLLHQFWPQTKNKIFIRCISVKSEGGSATLFVLVALGLFSAVIFSLTRTADRLIAAQRSQFVADDSAINCLLSRTDLMPQRIEAVARLNFAQVVEIDKGSDRCEVAIKVGDVVRRATAVSLGGLDLPTLQR